jgi:GNAT superfamily N-acetyltransferase
MEQVLVRKAITDDLEQLYLFEQGVIESERPFDPTLQAGHINYYDLKEMLHAPHIELVVAVAGNKIVASGYARIEDAKPYLSHDKHAYLGFMYAHPDYRGQGINKKIIEALKAWALSRHVKEMRLDVYFENVSAIKAYEKCGFSKHLIEMRLGLEE